MKDATAESYCAQHRERFLKEWQEFLRFPSISTDPAYAKDCDRCAEWLMRHLRSLGFDAQLISTPRKPLVYATKRFSDSGPRIAFYGHYDVQPVDPLELWTTPPFEPTWRDGRLYARGAQDNKGQLFYFIKGLEALAAVGALRGTMSLFIEGEEECGSEGITAIMPQLQERLASDVLLVCDTGCESLDRPAVTLGLRGIVGLTVTLSGLERDLHSGSHGGLVRNPATELARLIATLHNADGSIAVAGFYEGAEHLNRNDIRIAESQKFDIEEYKTLVGVEPLGGEAVQFSPVVRRGFRPTVEVNGIHSGYGGPGRKTIIPASAMAKITARLVADQDPDRCLDALVAHLTSHAPTGLTIGISERGVGGPPVLVSTDNQYVKKAAAVLTELKGRCEFLWEGGSIPVVAGMARLSKATPLLVGFGLEADAVHAPNESFGLAQFELGLQYVTRLLPRL